jgi:hypothetical protein
MTLVHLILLALLIVNILAILAAGWRYRGRHRAQKKYWRDYDDRELRKWNDL